jgi:hypothetical protein
MTEGAKLQGQGWQNDYQMFPVAAGKGWKLGPRERAESPSPSTSREVSPRMDAETAHRIPGLAGRSE